MVSYTNAIMAQYGDTESVTPSGAKCLKLEQKGDNIFCIENTESELKWLTILVCGSLPALATYNAFNPAAAIAALGISLYGCQNYLNLDLEKKYIKIPEDHKAIYIPYNQLNHSSEHNYTSNSVMQQLKEEFLLLKDFTNTAVPLAGIIAQAMLQQESQN